MAKISARGAYALAKWSKPSPVGASEDGTPYQPIDAWDKGFGTAMLTLRSDGAILERLYSGGAYRIVATLRSGARDRAAAIARVDRYAQEHGYARVGA
jgi:hypothetical protein